MVSENTRVTRFITYLEYYNGYPNPKEFVSAPKLSQACGYEVDTVRVDFRFLRKGFCERQWRRVGEMTQQVTDLLGLDQPKRIIMIGNDPLARARLTMLPSVVGNMDLMAIFDDAPEKRVPMEISSLFHPLGELESYLRENMIDFVIFAAGLEELQRVQPVLEKSDISGVLNLTDYPALVNSDIQVANASLQPGLVVLQQHIKKHSREK